MEYNKSSHWGVETQAGEEEEAGETMVEEEDRDEEVEPILE